MTRKEIAEVYKENFNPTLSLLFEIAKLPVELKGQGTRIFDEDYNSYLDFCAGYGVFAIGYMHEHVQRETVKQLDQLAMSLEYFYNEPAAKLVKKLADLLPGDLNRVFLTGSGSEAIEIAIRIAYLSNPDRKGFIAARNSYHGKTLGALSLMGQGHLREPFGSLIQEVNFVAYGNIHEMMVATRKGVLAVILEPVLGGGFIEAPTKGYLEEVKALCEETGTLLIIDEVQTGFGRTGKMFGIEHDNIIPDIVILSKGMTGGHTPIAAVVIRDELVLKTEYIYQEDPFVFGPDFSISPLVCASACAAIDVIEEERLVEKAAVTGAYLINELKKVAAAYPHFILDVPGCGLMTGIKLRNCLLENAVWLQLLKRKVIGGLSTNNHTSRPIMRLTPPLIIEKEEIDMAVTALEESLMELDRMPCAVYDLGNEVHKYQYYLPKAFLRFGTDLLSNPPQIQFKSLKAKPKFPKV
jgi:putrescine aminotransferase